MKQLIIALIGLLTLSGCQVSLAQNKNSIDRCIEKWQDKPV
ncbi:lipoprotein [Porphyromonas macacae]|nr:lipoprotein [Porphyromonas macacae]